MPLQTVGTGDVKDKTCSACGIVFWFVNPLGNFVGLRILSRAAAEIESEDYTLSIILSAMAVECELARLFMKWKEVDFMDKAMPTPQDRETWAEQWRKWVSIAVRFDKVSTLMTGEDLDLFLSHNPGLLKSTNAKYSVGASPKDFFIKDFFYKRNKIVHQGEIDFGQADGEMCYTLATTLFQIFKVMDEKRIKALDAKHAQNLGKGSLSAP
jgi:hypothetical protein